jgi:endonuclease/exonuclease/phosphatase family metal-dependent hydrolase
VIGRIEHALRRLRAALSRSEWLARTLRLQLSSGTRQQPGLVMVQIDGLSHREITRALRHGELPFLRRLIDREHYRLQPMYSGVPSTTAAVQGELFYGVRQAVPGFSYLDRESRELVRMIEAATAAKVERSLDEQSGQPLLAGGSIYAGNFTGGAEESHFCPTAKGWGAALRDAPAWAVVMLITSNLYSFLRVAALMCLELVIAVVDLLRGIISGKNFIKELKFVPTRVAITILLRELVVIGVKIDLARGLPIVHLNLLGYDEQAHRRGPDSRFAHWTLKGIDDAVSRLWKAAHLSQRRHYELWVYSDHGQESVTPYQELHQRSFAAAVADVFSEFTGKQVSCQVHSPWGAHLHRSEQLGTALLRRLLPVGYEAVDNPAGARLAIAALGPVAMIYWSGSLTGAGREELARRIVHQAKAPLVLSRDDRGAVFGWTPEGRIRLPADAERVIASDHPFRSEAADDLVQLCQHENAGEFIVCGTAGKTGKPLSFAIENGAHGGAGAAETSAFVLLPRDVNMAPVRGRSLRIGDLREAALKARNHGPEAVVSPGPTERSLTRTLRVVTYNVHSCIGMDGRLSPERIARVIARCEPDIVCLQELDMRRTRTGGVDQAHRIAEVLDMDYHFHPALHIEEERYGDAVLTHLPVKTVRTGALPHWKDLPTTEPRGALWVEVIFADVAIQVINTHLGLRARDRKLQLDALLGDHWLGHPDCRPPILFCGDLNALPRSRVCRRLRRELHDAQKVLPKFRPKATFAGRFPSARIDYVFVDSSLEVRSIEVPNNKLCRLASDHLPLVVELHVPAWPVTGSTA